MARILAIDTTGQVASLALIDNEGGDDRVVEEVELSSPENALFEAVQALLTRHDWSLPELDVFAVASGPGSFTGVRTGLTAAMGLAEAAGRKVVTVSKLMAMASFGTLACRAPLCDARRGKVYAAVYDAQLQIVQPEAVVKLDEWLHDVTNEAGDCEILVEEGSELLISLVGGLAEITRVPRILAGAVGRIAAERWRGGLAKDPAEVDANYVRRSDASLSWTDRASPVTEAERRHEPNKTAP